MVWGAALVPPFVPPPLAVFADAAATTSTNDCAAELREERRKTPALSKLPLIAPYAPKEQPRRNFVVESDSIRPTFNAGPDIWEMREAE
jgi:hypothetical protein